MIDTAQLELIVREVLRRMSVEAASSTSVSTSSAVSSPPTSAGLPTNVATASSGSPVTAPASNELRLTDRVITQVTLSGRLSNIRALVVPVKAVVTPAALDTLRRAGVELRRSAVSAAATGTSVRSTLGKFYVHATDAQRSLAPWVAQLPQDRWTAETLVACPLPQAVAELAAVLAGSDRLGLLLTSDLHAAVCLANRRESVRATIAADVASVQAAVKQIGANLLIIDPQRTATFAGKQLLRAFVADGPRGCPAAWSNLMTERP